MARTARACAGGFCYHVINRGNCRREGYHTEGDYAAFVALIAEASIRLPVRVVAFCLMPNHLHLALWPHADGDLSRWMQSLLTTHVRRYHASDHSYGHVWQGRFRGFPIQEDEYLLTVLRTIERKALRANLVVRAEHWPWSSLTTSLFPKALLRIHPGPVPRHRDWVDWVNAAMTNAELKALRQSVNRERPFGCDSWTTQTARRLGLESSLRPRGRPAQRSGKPEVNS